MKKNIKKALAEYFDELIYGGIDGIITTFAVVAGFTGAAMSSNLTTQISFAVVTLFGLANLFADAASMGLGNFLSVRSEKDLYKVMRRKEHEAIMQTPDSEVSKTIGIMQSRGFSPEDAATLAAIYRKNGDYWLDFIMQNGAGMSDPRRQNEALTGLATFLSFILFGSIPLIPFLLQESGNPDAVFMYSTIGTFGALAVLGLLKWKIIGTKLWASLLEVVLVGSTAAALAYYVGTFFVV